MSRLNWEKAQRDSQRAREAHEAAALRRSGQRAPIKANAKAISDKQRGYIKSLQSRTGTTEPMPRTAWQASNLIDHLRRIEVQQSRRA